MARIDTHRYGLSRTHNPKVAGSNPAPATNLKARKLNGFRAFVVVGLQVPTFGISQKTHTPADNRMTGSVSPRTIKGPVRSASESEAPGAEAWQLSLSCR